MFARLRSLWAPSTRSLCGRDCKFIQFIIESLLCSPSRLLRTLRWRWFVASVDKLLQYEQTFAERRQERVMRQNAKRRQRVVAHFWFSWCPGRRWAAAAFRLRIGGDDTQAGSVEVPRIMPWLVWLLAVWVGNVSMIAWKCRVRAFLHAFPPWFPSKVWRLRLPATRESARCRRRLFHGSIEVHTDSVSCLARVLISQREHERSGITHCSCRPGPPRSTHAALGLAKVNHIDGEGEIGMIRRRVSTQ